MFHSKFVDLFKTNNFYLKHFFTPPIVRQKNCIFVFLIAFFTILTKTTYPINKCPIENL